MEVQVDQLKDELANSQAKAEVGKQLGESQLILGFQVMKEALKIADPNFDLLKWDKVDLYHVFSLTELAMARSSQLKGEEGQDTDPLRLAHCKAQLRMTPKIPQEVLLLRTPLLAK